MRPSPQRPLFVLFGVLCLVPLLGHGQEEDAQSGHHKHKIKIHRSNAGSDVVSLGGNVVIAADETVDDVVVIGGNTRVEGTVTGDLVSILGKVTLGSNAVVQGDFVVVAGSVDSHGNAKIHGEQTLVGGLNGGGFPFAPRAFQDWFSKGVLLARPLPHQVGWAWAVAGVFILLYLLLAALFPRPIQASVEALQARPIGSFFVGLLALVLVAPLTLLLIVTVVGIVIVPFLICAFAAAFIFGKVSVYRYAGEQLAHQTGARALEKPLLALLVGILAFYVLYTVPVLGFVVWGAVVPLGIGAVFIALFRSYRPAHAQPAGIALPPLPGAPPPVMTPETPALMPRVGFWLRLLATAIDFFVIGMLTALCFRRAAGLFIPLWVVYHLAMWSLKGMTIGGIVLNLRIVRVDGRPIDFPIALVRCLAAILSAAVFFLGFFWAGWSADKQAWHDKIAGTCIVKIPKGVSLI